MFVKRYHDPTRSRRAAANLAWLHALGTDVRMPTLHAVSDHQLVFEQITGRYAEPDDLTQLADLLGGLHATAYQQQLHDAALDRPFQGWPDATLAAFPRGRQHVLDQVGVTVAGLPAAFYKDANIRNFLLADDGVAVVDFDDLTLAPFGYDLAKLLVSAAMTYGRASRVRLTEAVDAYNAATAHLGACVECTPAQIGVYAEVHWYLTAKYLGTHGYRFAWPDVRTALEERP